MSVDADIVSALATALPRLYRLEAPAKAQRPYGVYSIDDAVSETHIDGNAASLTNYDIEIEIYDTTPTAAATAAASVRGAMESASAFKSVCRGYRDIFDYDLTLPGVRILFSVWQ